MSADPDVDLSIVVACYNEETHLADSVEELLQVLEHTVWSSELVFVDDASSDGTRAVLADVVKKHGHRMPMKVLHHARNMGRGRTVADGFRATVGGVAGYLDIDLEVHARYIPAMVQALEDGADVALAERIYRVSPSPAFLLRHILSRGYRRLAAWWLGLADLDSEAGYKFFRREVLGDLLDACDDPGWFWDTEVMAMAQLRGLRITQVPCLFLRRSDKRSTLRLFSSTVDYLRKLVRFRRRLAELRGR